MLIFHIIVHFIIIIRTWKPCVLHHVLICTELLDLLYTTVVHEVHAFSFNDLWFFNYSWRGRFFSFFFSSLGKINQFSILVISKTIRKKSFFFKCQTILSRSLRILVPSNRKDVKWFVLCYGNLLTKYSYCVHSSS